MAKITLSTWKFAVIVLGCVSGLAKASTVYVASFGGHDYYLDSNNSFVGARADATALQGTLGATAAYLVAINDVNEKNFIQTTFNPVNQYWIGLSDAITEGTFLWDSGEALTYTNWNAGEPNNSGNEDYVVINQFGGTAGTWNDRPDTISIQSIIEVVPAGSAVPLPSAPHGAGSR